MLGLRISEGLKCKVREGGSTPVASTSISFSISYLREFLTGSNPLLSTYLRSGILADVFLFRTIQSPSFASDDAQVHGDVRLSGRLIE